MANVRDACAAGGIKRSAAEEYRRRDPVFAAAWRDAIADAYDALEGQAWQVALGLRKPGEGSGQPELTYDPPMMRFLLKQCRAERANVSRASELMDGVSIGDDEDPPCLDRGATT